MEATIAEMLATEYCDVVGRARRTADVVLDSELRMLGFDDVKVEAEKSISIKHMMIYREEAYLT